MFIPRLQPAARGGSMLKNRTPRADFAWGVGTAGLARTRIQEINFHFLVGFRFDARQSREGNPGGATETFFSSLFHEKS